MAIHINIPDNEKVGGAAHLPVTGHDEDDEQIADRAQDSDEPEQGRDEQQSESLVLVIRYFRPPCYVAPERKVQRVWGVRRKEGWP